MSTITLYPEDLTEFAKICAELVREGVLFEASKDMQGRFVIRFTGGF
jgi:hypothetical protein